MSDVDWTTANQRVLAAEFARVRARISGEDATTAEAELAQARAGLPTPAAIDVLVDLFGLSPFERDVLLLCAGYSMSEEFAKACAPHFGDTGVSFATFAQALALEGAHWTAITPVGALRASRLIHVHDERALLASRLSIEERVLHYLAGVNYLDPRLQSLVRKYETTSPLARSQQSAVEHAIQALEARNARMIVQLSGDDRAARREVARRISAHWGLGLRTTRSSDLRASRLDPDSLVALWNREATLLSTALLIEADEDDVSAVTGLVARFSVLTFIAGPADVHVDDALLLPVQTPDVLEQKELWHEALGESAQLLNGSIDAAAAQFRLCTSDIARTALELRSLPREYASFERAFWSHCRIRIRSRLDDLAQRIESTATWQDLVLPEQQISMLRQIAEHARHRLEVHERWGFAAKCARGLGISVLFSGESGTGKTLAAEVLANDLRLDLYRIDLSAMVSKYIGETEKNLRRVFDAAQASGAILLFDEADALFGKRSEVKDSHDRYANIEVSYLLQRMEEYRGLAILTTNLKCALDTAFQRRLQFIVQFPFPDAALRKRIWLGVFPRATPLHDVDPVRLAQLNVAGGNIRNIAMNAAFLAAGEGNAVAMTHLLQAARHEALKRDRPISDAEVRGWT
jgi:ATPase family associated with various cellular activities (AAA)/Winged helix domain, variant